MKIRKLVRILHRDFGYFITGMVIIYAISGIALNHRKDWNPHHIVIQESIELGKSAHKSHSKDEVVNILKRFDYEPVYKKHFRASSGILKVFVENGIVIFNPVSGQAEMELLIKRPVFYEINKLHLAGTTKLWVWVADVMSVILILVTLTGLFILKGKNGIKGRGLWLTLFGFLIPAIFLVFYV